MDENDFKRLLEASAAETQRRFDETAERLAGEMRTFVDANAAETRQLFDNQTAELTNRFETKTAEIRQLFEETTQELRRHFDVTAEEMKHEVQLVAERVIMVDERLTREAADIRTEMHQEFADTQAMIKFSHAELDRRFHALEEKAPARWRKASTGCRPAWTASKQ